MTKSASTGRIIINILSGASSSKTPSNQAMMQYSNGGDGCNGGGDDNDHGRGDD